MSSPPTPRTTPELVQGIITTQVGVDLAPFIAAANSLTTDLCTYKRNPYTDGYIGSKMELIERWLAAHFYAIFDAQLTQAKAGTVNVGYQYKIDYGLKGTMWGQQAIILDTKENLAKYDNSAQTKRRIKVSVGWLGHKHSWLYDGYVGEWSDMTTEM